MTAAGAAPDDLRETLARQQLAADVRRRYPSSNQAEIERLWQVSTHLREQAYSAADALLPVVTAYAERVARERAAEELRAAAVLAGVVTNVGRHLAARAAALAADDWTDPLAGLGEVARQAVADASPRGPLTGGLITPENPVGGLRPADDRTEDRA